MNSEDMARWKRDEQNRYRAALGVEAVVQRRPELIDTVDALMAEIDRLEEKITVVLYSEAKQVDSAIDADLVAEIFKKRVKSQQRHLQAEYIIPATPLYVTFHESDYWHIARHSWTFDEYDPFYLSPDHPEAKLVQIDRTIYYILCNFSSGKAFIANRRPEESDEALWRPVPEFTDELPDRATLCRLCKEADYSEIHEHDLVALTEDIARS